MGLCKPCDIIRCDVHRIAYCTGADGSRRYGIHLAAILHKRNRRCKAGKLAGKSGFLHLRAKARRFGKAGSAALDAREFTFRIHANGNLDGAAKTGNRDLRK